MKLYFSIDALHESGKQAWRLQRSNDHWRPCHFGAPLQQGDWRSPDVEEARAWHGLRLRLKHGTLQAREKPGRFDFLARGIFAHAILHRLSAAPIPERAQLQQQLREHPPGVPWLPYLNLAGGFAMLDTRDTPIIGNLRIAVRGEIASAAQYVGESAANDEAWVDALYRQFLAGWKEHLRSGRTGIFVPDAETLRPVEEYRAWIENWQPEREPT